ncbi:MAG: phosphoenolpyruvate--protein phosphotransferase [Solirubrobacterales bacterium]
MKKGTAASKGYGIGYVYLKKSESIEIASATRNIDAQVERQKLAVAVEDSREQLAKIRDRVHAEVGEEEAFVFDSHLMLLDDPEFTGAAFENIKNDKISAELAVQGLIDTYVEIFSSIEDEYLKERIADVKDVGRRLLNNLSGKREEDFSKLSENTIVVAHDLTPSDTAQLDKSKVAAFLTDIGGKTSHSAIMARTLEIPAVVGMGDISEAVKNGDLIIVDGIKGEVIINPDIETLNKYKSIKNLYDEEKLKLKELVNKRLVYKNLKHIEIAANIGSPEDVKKVIENGADGIGLFRTEFLYMDRDTMPTEDEQYNAYKTVLEKMENKPVVIRTLDVGGDKKLKYLEMPEEMNPFLGYRATRFCISRPDIFKVQLRALLRASIFGNLKIMFPMIATLKEFLEAKEILNQCKAELKAENLKFSDKIEVGIMVEIPSAALNADILAEHVDFFSIGTNDLIQYTLAADRMNERVSYLYEPMNPAVLKLIKMTIEEAHKAGKWCGMCGEMASDEAAVPTLLEYGLDEFSMNAASILNTKKLMLTFDGIKAED